MCHWQSKYHKKKTKLIHLFGISYQPPIITIVSTPCLEFNEDDFESESNELELACFDDELYSIL